MLSKEHISQQIKFAMQFLHGANSANQKGVTNDPTDTIISLIGKGQSVLSKLQKQLIITQKKNRESENKKQD